MSRSRLCLLEATDRNVSKSEPLLSTRREDGLWESIETDDDKHASAIQPNLNLAATVPPSSHKPQCSTKSVGVQTSPQPPLRAAPNDPTNLTAAADKTTKTVTTVRQLDPSSTYQQPLLPRGQQESIVGEPITPDPTRRRRGRPRKTSTTTNFRNPRRSVRFSDPPSLSLQQHEEEPDFGLLPSRDSHVFVRLLNVVIQQPQNLAIETRTGTTQEYSWNNRGKGWREADRRSDEGLVQIVSLFDSIMDVGVDIFPTVLPTEEKVGARQPVKMIWDGERACFVGMDNNQDGAILAVALGEMKDMARDPWARQFVGYIMK